MLIVSFIFIFEPSYQFSLSILQKIPVIGSLLRPENFIIFFVLSAIIISLDAFNQLDKPRQVKYSAIFWVGSVCLLVFLAELAGHNIFSQAAFPIATLVLIYIIAYYFQSRNGKKWKLFIVIVFVIDLFLTNLNLPFAKSVGKPGFPSEDSASLSDQKVIDYLNKDHETFRISVDQSTAGGEWNDGPKVWGFESINGFDPYLNKNYLAFLKENGVSQISSRTFNANIDKTNPVAFKSLNVKYYIINSQKNIKNNDFKLVENGQYKIYENLHFIPRYFLFSSQNNDFPQIIKPAQEIARTVNETKLKVYSPTNGASLFIGEIFYPGWKIMINGKDAKIIKINNIFMSVVVPQGTDNIDIYFDPTSLYYGLFISSLGLVAVFIVFSVEAYRHFSKE